MANNRNIQSSPFEIVQNFLIPAKIGEWVPHVLAAGFEYEVTIVDGQVMLEALNDAVLLGAVFLPLVAS